MEDLQAQRSTDRAVRDPSEPEARHRAVLSACADAIITIDARGIVQSASDSVDRVFGWKVEEIVGKTVNILMPEPYCSEHDGYLERYLRTGEARVIGQHREAVCVRRDGSTFPCEISIARLDLSANSEPLFTGIIRESSERHAAEARMRQLARGIESVVESIVMTDARGTIQYVNPAFTRLTGHTAEEAIGRNPRVLKSGRHGRDFYRRMWGTILRGDIWNGELTNRRKDGTKYDCQLTIAPVKDEDGAVSGFIAVQRDITDQRRMEKELKDKAADLKAMNESLASANTRMQDAYAAAAIANEALEEEIGQRRAAEEQLSLHTVEIEARNLELQCAKADVDKIAHNLRESNRELEDFAYVASHDLKEPLRGIHNYASFLLEDYADKFDADGRHKLETLPRLTQRLETLIDALLHFSRVGRLDLAIQHTDLEDVLADVLDSLHVTLQERGIEVRRPEPLPAARCDQARVSEVFRNLITNAMKYNDKPKKWIEIGVLDAGASEEDDGNGGTGGVGVFYVRDNGIGIREKHIDSIFRIFKRLHGRDKYGGGTGAGLTIVKKIVERHGGRLRVDSVYGEGTTFYFTLQGEHQHDGGDAAGRTAHSPG